MRSINKTEKINKDTDRVDVEFSAKNITPYGGLGLFHKFNRKLGIEKILDKVNPDFIGTKPVKTQKGSVRRLCLWFTDSS